jgi:ubiquinone/menaquinone biosynthesis C-methylase UbiE
LTPKNLPTFEAAELDYWDQRTHYEQTVQDIASHYDQDALSDNFWNLYPYAKVFRGLAKDSMILEVGAGSVTKGLYLLLFQRFSNVVMTDLSGESLRVNKQIAERRGMNAEGRYYAADMGSLPFSDNTFDVVMVHAALHHAADPQKTIHEITRCLKADGTLIIGHEPNKINLKAVRGITRLFGLTERQTQRLYSVADERDQGFERSALSRMLNEAGITIKQTIPVWYFTGFLFNLPILVKKVFGKQIFVTNFWRDAAINLDQIIALIPLINQLCFHWTIIGHKEQSYEPNSKNNPASLAASYRE